MRDIETRDFKKRIEKEEKRLSGNFSKLEKKKKGVTKGLIKRAAFMRISLHDLEEDLNKNGFTEYFSQGDQEPYLRERPAAKIYNSLNAGYQKIIKQLTDLLPKEDAKPKGGDEFDDF